MARPSAATAPDMRPGLSADASGVLMVCAGLFLFSLQDSAIKYLSDGYSVFQIVIIRSLIGLPLVLVIWRWRSGETSLAAARVWTHIARVCLMFAAYMGFYLAIAALPLAVVVSIAFSAPLIIVALSALAFGDPVGPRRWAAVLVGFCGILVIVQPGRAAFEPAALLALISAFCYAGGAVLARHLGATDSGAKMAVYAVLGYLVFGALGMLLAPLAGDASHPSLIFATAPWRPAAGLDLALICATGVIAAFGFYFVAEAYRVGAASAVAPFEYTGLLWTVLWGVLFFGETPGLTTYLGIVLIVGSGLFVLHRERVRDVKIRRRVRPRSRPGL